MPVCVSSVEPEQFPAAVAAGAAMVEIGNFDAFLPEGRVFALRRCYLTRRTRELLPEVVLGVTGPVHRSTSKSNWLWIWWRPSWPDSDRGAPVPSHSRWCPV